MFNPYMSTYNPQMTASRIDNQIAELQKMKEQLPQQPMPQQPSINQTFQLTPNNNEIKYADTIDDVNKQVVITDTPFFSKDMSVMWLKNTNGDIKAYKLSEIIQKDEKDLMIESLQLQIDELKKGTQNEQPNNNDDTKPTTSKKSTSISNGKSSNAKQK